MSISFRGLFAAGVLTVLSVEAAGLPAHPRLLLNEEGITQLKERIAAAPWAGREWASLKKQAEAALAFPVELPPRGGNWSHNYVCPTHGSRLSRGEQLAKWEWEHHCPTGPHTLRGDRSKAALDFDGNGISAVHADLAQAVVDHGLVFQVTGDRRHAARSREILLAYADRYLSYPLHNNQGKPGSGARVASQPLTEASWMIVVAQGADLVWETLSEAERVTLREKLFMPALEEVIINRRPSIHNIQCRINSAIGLVGFLLGDQRLIDRAIHDEGSGYWQQMARGVLDDGMWFEGSSGYHFFTIAGLWPLTEAARNCGTNLYGPRLKTMFDAPLLAAMPNLVLPDFNDTGMVPLANQDATYELAWARYGDARYATLLQGSDRQNRLAMLYGRSDLPTLEPAPLEQRNLEASGYAILQKGEKANATWLCVKYGPHGGGHGHPDKNNFVLYTRGGVLAPDGGTHAYGSSLHNSWDKTTAAHNTLVINQTNQLPATGKMLAFGEDQGVQFSMTDAGDIGGGVRFIRTVALLEPNLVVFIDQVEAATESTLDLHYHQHGKWVSPPKGEAWMPPEIRGYMHFMNGTTRRAGSSGIELRTEIERDWTSRIVVGENSEGPETEVITGYGILKTTDDRVPWLIQRRRCKATAFVWALSLDGTRVDLRTNDVDDASGSALPRWEAVQVQVKRAERQWSLAVNPGRQQIKVAGKAGNPAFAVIKPNR